MTKQLIQLKLNEFILQFSEEEWCEVTLIISGQSHYLGADSRNLVLQRFLNGFTKDFDFSSGKINGVPISCVLTLFEAHHTIYLGEIDGKRCLYFQDGDGQIIAEVLLPASDLSLWIENLREHIKASEV
ncbi:hypothetical protein [Pseudanabaena sp. UWO310]|uniref:hypothetical protein n=1 Tax=Pseudanabaena sp. UWO310 TaxID=2480795 RepID=UPI001157CACB|nr:hypothetical protein [Pseudanabaena sp. UWO310]TYQ30022.1 hypothetical protein PseudUWO310_10770 [Pseudanabaena sp. UWO310]